MTYEEKLIAMLDNDKRLLRDVYYYAGFQFMPYEERPILMGNFDYEFQDNEIFETIQRLSKDFDSSDDYFINGIYEISSVNDVDEYVINNADYHEQINLITVYYCDVDASQFRYPKMRDFVNLCHEAVNKD